MAAVPLVCKAGWMFASTGTGEGMMYALGEVALPRLDAGVVEGSERLPVEVATRAR